MSQEQQKPARLAGICKKCHSFRFGYLLYGHGPFICYQCAEAAAKRIPPTTTTTNAPGALYFSYTFTTSNSTSSNWPTENSGGTQS